MFGWQKYKVQNNLKDFTWKHFSNHENFCDNQEWTEWLNDDMRFICIEPLLGDK